MGAGLIEALSQDGVLPAVPQALTDFNHAVGDIVAPFSPLGPGVGSAVTDLTGSHTAGFVAGVGADSALYGAAGAVAGPLGVGAVAGYSGLEYLATRSDLAVGTREAIGGLSDLGIDTSFGTFGHGLATDLREGTSGLMTNLPETRAAVDNFGQLYQSNAGSGADLRLTTPQGWGAADEGAQERLMTLRDVALQGARDPGLAGGAIYFPDGTQAEWVRRPAR